MSSWVIFIIQSLLYVHSPTDRPTFLYGWVQGLGQQMSRVVPVHIRLPLSVMIIINIVAINSIVIIFIMIIINIKRNGLVKI